jgi:hypothetical protein
MPRWLTAVDPEDLAQERELAHLENRCPKAAVRSYLRQEHRFYDIIVDFPLELAVAIDTAISLPGPVRSTESIEQRKAYSRAWWRTNGAAYRAKRKQMNGPVNLSRLNPADSTHP